MPAKLRLTHRPQLAVGRILGRPHVDDAVHALASHVVAETLVGSQALDLAFAYYDGPLLRALLGALKKRPPSQPIRLLVNGLARQGLSTQATELKSLVRWAKPLALEVRLFTSAGIFHPKLVLSRHQGHSFAWLGSANGTTAAFEANEELLLQLTGDVSPLTAYFEAVWSQANPLESLRPEGLVARSLPAFFRTGTLYFQPSATLAVTLNPFTPLLNGLRDRAQRALGAIPLSYAEGQSAIGAFNVERALGLTQQRLKANDDPNVSVGLRHFGFETSLGYWVPPHRRADLEARIERKAARRRKRLEALHEALETVAGRTLERRFERYLADVRQAFKDAKVPARASANLRRDPFTDVTAFRAFVQQMKTKLRDGDQVDRLSRPLVESRVPEIWDDARMSADFTESFFASSLFQMDWAEARAGSLRSSLPRRRKIIEAM
jgi:hypothetical protein